MSSSDPPFAAFKVKLRHVDRGQAPGEDASTGAGGAAVDYASVLKRQSSQRRTPSPAVSVSDSSTASASASVSETHNNSNNNHESNAQSASTPNRDASLPSTQSPALSTPSSSATGWRSQLKTDKPAEKRTFSSYSFLPPPPKPSAEKDGKDLEKSNNTEKPAFQLVKLRPVSHTQSSDSGSNVNRYSAGSAQRARRIASLHSAAEEERERDGARSESDSDDEHGLHTQRSFVFNKPLPPALTAPLTMKQKEKAKESERERAREEEQRELAAAYAAHTMSQVPTHAAPANHTPFASQTESSSLSLSQPLTASHSASLSVSQSGHYAQMDEAFIKANFTRDEADSESESDNDNDSDSESENVPGSDSGDESDGSLGLSPTQNDHTTDAPTDAHTDTERQSPTEPQTRAHTQTLSLDSAESERHAPLPVTNNRESRDRGNNAKERRLVSLLYIESGDERASLVSARDSVRGSERERDLSAPLPLPPTQTQTQSAQQRPSSESERARERERERQREKEREKEKDAQWRREQRYPDSGTTVEHVVCFVRRLLEYPRTHALRIFEKIRFLHRTRALLLVNAEPYRLAPRLLALCEHYLKRVQKHRLLMAHTHTEAANTQPAGPESQSNPNSDPNAQNASFPVSHNPRVAQSDSLSFSVSASISVSRSMAENEIDGSTSGGNNGTAAPPRRKRRRFDAATAAADEEVLLQLLNLCCMLLINDTHRCTDTAERDMSQSGCASLSTFTSLSHEREDEREREKQTEREREPYNLLNLLSFTAEKAVERLIPLLNVYTSFATSLPSEAEPHRANRKNDILATTLHLLGALCSHPLNTTSFYELHGCDRLVTISQSSLSCAAVMSGVAHCVATTASCVGASSDEDNGSVSASVSKKHSKRDRLKDRSKSEKVKSPPKFPANQSPKDSPKKSSKDRAAAKLLSLSSSSADEEASQGGEPDFERDGERDCRSLYATHRLARSLEDALSLHPDSALLVQHVCDALRVLATVAPDTNKYARFSASAGEHSLSHSLAQELETQENAFFGRRLRTARFSPSVVLLSQNEEVLPGEEVSNGVRPPSLSLCDALVAALASHKARQTTVLAVVRAIVRFARNQPLLAEQLAQSGCCEAMLEIAELYKTDAIVLLPSLVALSFLAIFAENRRIFLRAHLCERVLRALSHYRRQRSVLCAACACVRALCVESECRAKFRELGAADALLDLLDLHQTRARVCEEVLGALWALSCGAETEPDRAVVAAPFLSRIGDHNHQQITPSPANRKSMAVRESVSMSRSHTLSMSVGVSAERERHQSLVRSNTSHHSNSTPISGLIGIELVLDLMRFFAKQDRASSSAVLEAGCGLVKTLITTSASVRERVGIARGPDLFAEILRISSRFPGMAEAARAGVPIGLREREREDQRVRERDREEQRYLEEERERLRKETKPEKEPFVSIYSPSFGVADMDYHNTRTENDEFARSPAHNSQSYTSPSHNTERRRLSLRAVASAAMSLSLFSRPPSSRSSMSLSRTSSRDSQRDSQRDSVSHTQRDSKQPHKQRDSHKHKEKDGERVPSLSKTLLSTHLAATQRAGAQAHLSMRVPHSHSAHHTAHHSAHHSTHGSPFASLTLAEQALCEQALLVLAALSQTHTLAAKIGRAAALPLHSLVYLLHTNTENHAIVFAGLAALKNLSEIRENAEILSDENLGLVVLIVKLMEKYSTTAEEVRGRGGEVEDRENVLCMSLAVTRHLCVVSRRNCEKFAEKDMLPLVVIELKRCARERARQCAPVEMSPSARRASMRHREREREKDREMTLCESLALSLTALSLHCPHNQAILGESGACAVLCGLVNSSMQDTPLLEICISAMQALSENAQNQMLLGENDACALLVSVLGRHIGNITLAESTCGVMCNISELAVNKERFAQKNAVSLLLETLALHKTSARVALSALTTLHNLSYNAENRTLLEKSKSGRVLLKELPEIHKADQGVVDICNTLKSKLKGSKSFLGIF